MQVLGEKRGGCFTMPCDWCDGQTGFLYIIKESEKKYEICTTCRALYRIENKFGKDNAANRLMKMYGHQKEETK